MKAKKLTLISLTLLATLLIGAIAIIIVSAPPKIKLKGQWRPTDYVLDTPVPDPWNVELWLLGDYGFDEIDPDSIVLEGYYTPIFDPYGAEDRERLVVPFNGYDVLLLVMLKAGHLAPGEFRIWLEITGEHVDKKTGDRTPFQGQVGITLIVPEANPP